MEEDWLLEEQDDFLQRGQGNNVSFSATRVPSSSNKSRENASLVSDIIERSDVFVDESRVVVLPEAPTRATNQGFPEASHRAEKSPLRGHGFNLNVNEEVDERIASMSTEEIRNAQREIEERLPPDLVSKLRARGAAKIRNQIDHVHSYEVTEDRKKDWMRDVSETVESEEEMTKRVLVEYEKLGPSALWRYDLEATRLTEQESMQLPTDRGLHHHGLQPGLAGYTVPELILLCRSSYCRQRVVALEVLSRVFARTRSGEESHDVVNILSRAEDALVSIVSSMLGWEKNTNLIHAWCKCLRSLFVVESVEVARDAILSVNGYSTQPLLATGSRQEGSLEDRAVDAGITQLLVRILESHSGSKESYCDALSLFATFCTNCHFINQLLQTNHSTLVPLLWRHTLEGNTLARRAVQRLAAWDPTLLDLSRHGTSILHWCISEKVDNVEFAARIWRFAIEARILYDEFSASMSTIAGRIHALAHQASPFLALSELFLLFESYVEFIARGEDSQALMELCQLLLPIAEVAVRFGRSTWAKLSEGTRPQLVAAASAFHLVVTIQSFTVDLRFFQIGTMTAEIRSGLSLASMLVGHCWEHDSPKGWPELPVDNHFCGSGQEDGLRLAALSSCMIAFGRSFPHDFTISRSMLERELPLWTENLYLSLQRLANSRPGSYSAAQLRCSLVYKLLLEAVAEWTVIEARLRPQNAPVLVKRVLDCLCANCVEKDLLRSVLRHALFNSQILEFFDSEAIGAPVQIQDETVRSLVEASESSLESSSKDAKSNLWLFLSIKNGVSLDEEGIAVLLRLLRSCCDFGLINRNEGWRLALEVFGRNRTIYTSPVVETQMAETLFKVTSSVLDSNQPLLSDTLHLEPQIAINGENESDEDVFGRLLVHISDLFVSEGPSDALWWTTAGSALLVAMLCPRHGPSARHSLWRRLILDSGAASLFDRCFLVPPLHGYFPNASHPLDPITTDLYRMALSDAILSPTRSLFLHTFVTFSLDSTASNLHDRLPTPSHAINTFDWASQALSHSRQTPFPSPAI